MRFSFFFVLMVSIFVGGYFNIARAKQEVVIKLIDDVVSKVKTTKLQAQTNPDKNLAIVKYNEGAKLKNLDSAPTGNLKASNQLKNVDEAQDAKTTESVAKEEVFAKSFGDIWKRAILKVKVVNAINSANLRAQTTPDNGWESASVKLNEGAKLEKLDTASTSQWKTTFDKLKGSNQLKNIDEAQAAKITEGVAREVAKNPSKWRFIKTVAEITFGAVLVALIVVGLQLMVK